MPQIPSRLPRKYESPSPDHRTWYTGVVNTVLRYSNALHLHQRVCHKVGDTMVRTSRFTVCFCARDSVFTSGLHVVEECGIHDQWKTNPANLQCCCSTEAETGFVPTSAQINLRCSLLNTDVSILNSFLYPEVPCVNVLRSLSCSQSIRQRIRRRNVTFVFQSSFGMP